MRTSAKKTDAIRLLYIVTLPDLGGAQSHVLELARGLRTAFDLHLATGRAGPLTFAARELDVPVHFVPSLGRDIDPASDAAALREITALLRHLHPDLVHAHSSKAGFIGRLAARIVGAPAVFTAHGWGFTPGVPWLRAQAARIAETLAAPLASAIICVSAYDAGLARKYLPCTGNRVFMVHNGIPVDAPVASPARQPARVIMVARFSEPKDQSLLLRAFATARGQSQARLVLVGSGPELPACQLLARRLGIAPFVDFLGDREDVPSLLAGASILALTTRYEGLPVSILEAMRAGLPVVASDVGGIAEQVEHGTTGILVPRGDVDATAAALCMLLRDPSLRQAMGEAGRRKFLREFTVDRMLAQTEAIYARVLAEGPAPS